MTVKSEILTIDQELMDKSVSSNAAELNRQRRMSMLSRPEDAVFKRWLKRLKDVLQSIDTTIGYQDEEVDPVRAYCVVVVIPTLCRTV